MCSGHSRAMKRWQPDRLLAGYEALELEFPADYDGPVLATLVRLPTARAERGAVLYVHGYTDYFFQRHMALRFAAEGYAFYAIDLRKHGRSLRPHQHPNFCKRIDEYYADLAKAIDVIGAPVLLAGHSTGGLNIGCPILAMHSDEADVVLDWRHIARYSRGLGPEVTVLAFPGGIHDLVLSRSEVREEVFRQLFAWAARVPA